VRASKATLGHLFDGRMTIDVSDLPPTGTYDYAIRPGQRNSITFFLTVIDANDRWASDSFTLYEILTGTILPETYPQTVGQ
jgi:hypothetical protein